MTWRPRPCGRGATLDANSVGAVRRRRSVYGPEDGEAFLGLWREHIGFFVDYTLGQATGDQAASDQALTDLEGYQQAAGAFFEEITGGELPADALVGEPRRPHRDPDHRHRLPGRRRDVGLLGAARSRPAHAHGRSRAVERHRRRHRLTAHGASRPHHRTDTTTARPALRGGPSSVPVLPTCPPGRWTADPAHPRAPPTPPVGEHTCEPPPPSSSRSAPPQRSASPPAAAARRSPPSPSRASPVPSRTRLRHPRPSRPPRATPSRTPRSSPPSTTPPRPCAPT